MTSDGEFEVGDIVEAGPCLATGAGYTQGKHYVVEAMPHGAKVVYGDTRTERYYACSQGNGWFVLVKSISKKRKGMR